MLLIGLLLMLAYMVQQNVSFSMRESRLATIPRYDDVTYLLDALQRLKLLSIAGFAQFLSHFVFSPPHAPVSTLTAMFSFGVLGPSVKWAYVANAWILALYIGAVAVISRPLGGAVPRLLFVAVSLFAPASHAMITEFRPDMAAGLLFALTLVAIISVDLTTASRRRRLAIAALAVFATIAKPSGSVVVIPGIGIAFLVSILLQVFIDKASLKVLLLRSVLPIVGYLLILAPFALILGPETIAYVYQALVSNSDIWKTNASREYHWAYHLLGEGGKQAIGPLRKLGIGVLAVDLLVLLFVGKARDRVLGFGMMLTLVFLYCAMSMSAEKTPYQGSYFYFPFLIALALAGVRLLAKIRDLSRRAWIGPVILMACLIIIGAKYPLASSYTAYYPLSPELPPLLDGTVDHILEFARDRPANSACANRVPTLLSPNPDPVVPETVEMATLVRGGLVRPNVGYFVRSQAEMNAAIDDVDLVLIPDPDMVDLNKWLPGSAFLRSTMESLQHDARWRGQIVGYLQGKPLWLFARAECLPQPTG